MTSARTSGAVSGAASGAAIGSMFAPGIGTAVGAGVGFVAGLISGGSADAQQANQTAWATYNNAMQHQTNLFNIRNSLTLGAFNAMQVRQAARIEAQNAQIVSQYNAELIAATVSYNNSLLENELIDIWEAEDLELQQLDMFRAREASQIYAHQSVSGTVIGEGGNADILVEQATARAMDATVIHHNAEKSAAAISNQIAQNRWNGNNLIKKTIWEGELLSYTATANANIQAAGILFGSALKGGADLYTSKQGSYMGNVAISMANDQFSAQNTQNMIAGLFQAGATAGSVHFANKIPTTVPSTPRGGGGSSANYYGGYSPIGEPGRSIATDLN